MKKAIHKLLNKVGCEISRDGYRSFMWYINTHCKNKADLTGVEIGTWKGENASRICKYLDMDKLYLIDPYKCSSDYSDEWGGKPIDDTTLKLAKNEAEEKLIWSECEFIELESDKAVSKVPNDLDFVYIDGDHSYSAVTSDIENYYLKVKDGGVIAGHNINRFSVTSAVVDFCRKNNIKQVVFKGEDWIIHKGAKEKHV